MVTRTAIVEAPVIITNNNKRQRTSSFGLKKSKSKSMSFSWCLQTHCCIKNINMQDNSNSKLPSPAATITATNDEMSLDSSLSCGMHASMSSDGNQLPSVTSNNISLQSCFCHSINNSRQKNDNNNGNESSQLSTATDLRKSSSIENRKVNFMNNVLRRINRNPRSKLKKQVTTVVYTYSQTSSLKFVSNLIYFAVSLMLSIQRQQHLVGLSFSLPSRVLLFLPTVLAANNYYYYYSNNDAVPTTSPNDDASYYNSNDGYNYTEPTMAPTDDGVSNSGDDEYNAVNYNAAGASAANDDLYSADGGDDDDAYNNSSSNQADDGVKEDDDYYGIDDDVAAYNGDDNAYNQANKYRYSDDDQFHWNHKVGFDGVNIMPLSCINYNSGHMIKFQLYDAEKSYQCHFSEIATFVVSIAHFMRAYFNYQALSAGVEFKLPDDAAYLNCLQLQVATQSGMPLYAKVGCMQRETFTSTKLQLHLYTDAQCSQQYDDGQTSRKHISRGYIVGDQVISSKVSFRPEFYSCMSCEPDMIAYTFNKRNSNWYDDDYIVQHGNKATADDDAAGSSSSGSNSTDDGSAVDDQYYNNNDDYSKNYYQSGNSNTDDGNRRRRQLDGIGTEIGAPVEVLREYNDAFWSEYYEYLESQQKEEQEKDLELGQHSDRRTLYGNNYYDVGDWNMCQRVFKYGVYCDEECRALDFFRTNVWSASDVYLLVFMCLFMTALMLLIIAKRLKAQQKARLYGDDHPIPGLPPISMAIIYVDIMVIIVILSAMKFINETLVFAVVTCVLLFIYMLKLTLFESRRPILLAAPRHHDMFDNPLDDRLFD